MNVVDTYIGRIIHADVTDMQAHAVCELLNGAVGPDGRFVSTYSLTAAASSPASAAANKPVGKSTAACTRRGVNVAYESGAPPDRLNHQ